MTNADSMELLCALAPPPRERLVTCRGVLAPVSGLRPKVAPRQTAEGRDEWHALPGAAATPRPAQSLDFSRDQRNDLSSRSARADPLLVRRPRRVVVPEACPAKFARMMIQESADQGQASASSRGVDFLRNEVARLRASASFRLGSHLVGALTSPKRFLALPFTLPALMWRLWRESRGRSPRAAVGSTSRIDPGGKRTIVMFPTNGVGFGHFTRLYAIARRIRVLAPDIDIVFVTTMPTLHVLYREKFPAYHLSGPRVFSMLSGGQWDGMLEEVMSLVLERHRPEAFVFDGAHPYAGMLRSLRSARPPRTYWVKRGMARTAEELSVQAQESFDAIVVPGDAEDTHMPVDSERVEVKKVAPIVLLDPEEMLDCAAARARLSLPATARCAYVQLGAGQINDIQSTIHRVLEALLAHDDVYVVLGESLIGQRIGVERDRVRVISDYPNSLYFRAFDVAVQAGGYNSFHEMRTLRTPTLFLPNAKTAKDDQRARCKVAEVEGWGLVADEDAPDFREAVNDLLRLAAAGSALVPRPAVVNGADEAAKWIAGLHAAR